MISETIFFETIWNQEFYIIIHDEYLVLLAFSIPELHILGCMESLL
jgi:hypothetical protein